MREVAIGCIVGGILPTWAQRTVGRCRPTELHGRLLPGRRNPQRRMLLHQ